MILDIQVLILDCKLMIDDFDRMGPAAATVQLGLIEKKLDGAIELITDPDTASKLLAIKAEAQLVANICINGYPLET